MRRGEGYYLMMLLMSHLPLTLRWGPAPTLRQGPAPTLRQGPAPTLRRGFFIASNFRARLPLGRRALVMRK